MPLKISLGVSHYSNSYPIISSDRVIKVNNNSSSSEKSTLGDLDALQELKEKMDKGE